MNERQKKEVRKYLEAKLSYCFPNLDKEKIENICSNIFNETIKEVEENTDKYVFEWLDKENAFYSLTDIDEAVNKIIYKKLIN